MQFEFYKSENLLLKVDKEGKECYLKVRNKTDNTAVSESELLDLLEKAGITHGFENAKQKRQISEDFILIALADDDYESIKPDFMFKIPKNEIEDVETLTNSTYLKKNQIVASFASASRKSLNIFGKPNISAKKLNLEIDNNFQIINNNLICLQNGYPYFDIYGKLNLLTEFTEKNDIFKKFLNLNIKMTFQKDIISSEIESSEEITVSGAVKDCKKIYSDKDIYLSLAIDSTIISKGNIYFSGKITDCKLIASKKIIGTGNSKVVSGNLVAGNSIELSRASSKTTLEIALAPVEKELLKIIKEKNLSLVTPKKLLNEVEKQFYNFENQNTNAYIKIKDNLSSDIYLRIFNRSFYNKKQMENFTFS